MRLLVRTKIWRAFPELDRFSDEQCARFAKAARKSRGWLDPTYWAEVVVTLAVCVFAGVTAAYLLGFIGSWQHRSSAALHADAWRAVVVISACIGGTLLCLLLWRDVTLRRRVHFVLRRRGVCSGCQYSLVGLRVPQSLIIECPECGASTAVDESLGELKTDGSGQRVFVPPPVPASVARKASKRWGRRLAKVSLLLLLLLLLGGGAAWFLWNRHLQEESRLARSEAPTIAQAMEAVRSVLPPEESGTEAWKHLSNLAVALDQASDAARRRLRPGVDSLGNPVHAVFTSVYVGPEHREFATEDDHAAYQTLARAALEEFERGPGIKHVESLVRTAGIAQPVLAGDAPAATSADPRLDQAGAHIGQFLIARLHVTQESGRWSEFVLTFAASLRVARMIETTPGWRGFERGQWIRADALQVLRRALDRHPDEATLDALAAAMDAGQRAPFEGVTASARLAALSEVTSAYADPVFVRGQHFRAIFDLDRNWLFRGGAVGSYSRCRDEVNASFAALDVAARLQPFERKGNWLPARSCAPTVHVVGLMERRLESRDLGQLDHLGTRVMLEIERFRLREGRLPAKLSELGPRLFEPPPDPWSGKPLIYRCEGGEDGQPERYMLYSVGFDGADNGGIVTRATFERESRIGNEGMDLVITDPRRR